MEGNITDFNPKKSLLSGGAVNEFSNLIEEGNRDIHDKIPEIQDKEGVLSEADEKIDKSVNTDLKKSEIFTSVDISDFNDFNIYGLIPENGQISFMVEQRFLKSAAAVTRLTVGAAGTNTGNVRFVIIDNKIKLLSFNQNAFAEVIIPTITGDYIKVGTDTEKDWPAFIFDQRVLNRIADFGDEVIEFRVDYSKSLLVIKAGKTHLEFSILPESEFVQYKSKITNLNYIDKVNTDILSEAIQYVSRFIKKDDVQVNFSLADCRNGKIVSGSFAAVGIFEAEDLNKVPFKVKFEALNIIGKALQHFGLENTHLFNSESYHIIRDENLYIGFEQTQLSFPPVEKHLEFANDGDVIVIPRRQILNSLYKLSVVSATKDHPVLCKISGKEDGAILNISIKDIAGKVSQDEIKVFRNVDKTIIDDKGNIPDIIFVLNMDMLSIAASNFDTANIHLKFISNKAVMLEDNIDNRFSAYTILSLME